MTPNQIEQQRDRIYRRTRAARVRTMDDAAEFIDTVGFCLLFASTQVVELPSLFEAVKGRRDAHIEDWDRDSDRVWVWKNDLPGVRQAYYGKALAGGKPVFVSLKMLPYLLALVAPENLHDEYARGRLSIEAKRLYDTLSALGPMPTKALRLAAGFDRSGDNLRYHRALDELQRMLVIAPIGATVETGNWTSQIFELVTRWFPRQVARAQKLEQAAARRALARRYVQTVYAARPPMLARVFGWSREQVNATLADLLARRMLIQQDDWMIAA